jgi:hypothetical protein
MSPVAQLPSHLTSQFPVPSYCWQHHNVLGRFPWSHHDVATHTGDELIKETETDDYVDELTPQLVVGMFVAPT